MLKFLAKLFAVISLFAIIIIAKEFLEILMLLKSIWSGFAYIFIALICFILAYFVVIPLWKIYILPSSFQPTSKHQKIHSEYKRRLKLLAENKYLKEIGYVVLEKGNEQESYDMAIQKLEEKSKEIREKYVRNVFYSTTIAQNGFLDAVLILLASINLIKEIFSLFNGRVSNRDVWTIFKQIYYSMAVGGTEITEFTVDELIKIGPKAMESIPFAGKILKSIADGYVNAVLLTRVALITENYCKIVYVESKKDLYPSPTYIASVAKDITKDIREKISSFFSKNIKRLADKAFTNSKDAIRWIYKNSIGELISPDEKTKGNNFAKYLKVATVVVAPGAYVASIIGIKLFKRTHSSNE